MDINIKKVKVPFDKENLDSNDSESEDLSQSEREELTIDGGGTERYQHAEDGNASSLRKLLNYSTQQQPVKIMPDISK